MKVSAVTNKKMNHFQPFTVSFTIETEEEASAFHNNVAIKVTGGPHEFIGNVYRRIRESEVPDYQGEI